MGVGYIDQYGNELVAAGAVDILPGAVQFTEFVGGRSRLLGSVARRYRVEPWQALSVAVGAIPVTSAPGSFSFGGGKYVDHLSELLFTVSLPSTATGAGNALEFVAETHNLALASGNQGWMPLTPDQVTVISGGAPTIANGIVTCAAAIAAQQGPILLMKYTAGVGALVRVGVAVTTATWGGSGSLTVEMQGKA